MHPTTTTLSLRKLRGFEQKFPKRSKIDQKVVKIGQKVVKIGQKVVKMDKTELSHPRVPET